MFFRLSFLLALSTLWPASISFGQSPYHYRDRGLMLGGLMGAVTGGLIGEHNDETGAGLAIGTAVGALTGAAIGDSIDTDIAWSNAARQQQLARQMSRAVTVQDVMAMSQAKLGDAVIITHIRTNGIVSRPQPAELIMMSEAGVSNTVIQAMQTAPLAAAQPYSPPVYRNRVIVQEHHYVAPYPGPAWYPWPHYHHHCSPGFHWGVTFGR